MSTPADANQQADFLAGRPVANVAFAHDDLVTILSGDNAGNVGTLVRLAACGDDPVYVVEIDSGFEVEVAQSALERAED